MPLSTREGQRIAAYRDEKKDFLELASAFGPRIGVFDRDVVHRLGIEGVQPGTLYMEFLHVTTIKRAAA